MRTPIRLLAVALGAGLTLWATAQAPPPLSTAQAARAVPHAIGPGVIDTARSRVYARVHKTGFGHEHGVEGRLLQGELHLDEAQSGSMSFDMASFQADTSDARRYVGLSGEQDAATQADVTRTMQGPDVLDVQRHPRAEFVLQRAVPRAGKAGEWDLYGELTLHGVKRPVQVASQATSEGSWIHLRGGFAIRQSEFGIRPLRKAFGAIGVADQMEIWGDLWLAAQ